MQFASMVFITLVCLTLGLRLYLSLRQIRSIKVGLSSVPLDFSDVITFEQHIKAGKYNIAKLKLSMLEYITTSIVLLYFTLGGGLNYLTNFTSILGLNALSSGVVILLSYIILNGVITTILNYFSVFKIEQSYGFNKMTSRLFWLDTIKSLILLLIIGIPLFYLILWLINYFNSNWWVYVWLVMVGFNLLALIIYPTFIAPLFNKFTLLNNPELKLVIDKLLTRCGFKANGVFVMDGSKRSSHGNAYFTGMGKSKRIVFFDTLLTNLMPIEIEAVLAHELGHFKKKHILKQMIMSFMLMLVMVYIASVLMNNQLLFSALGVSNISTANGLILAFSLLSLITFIFAPLFSYLSRKNEFEADSYAAKVSSKDALISGLIKLYKDNAATLTPDYLYVLFYYSHPPASIRIAQLRAS